MRSISRFVGVLLVSAAATSGCSLYLDFEPTGLACDADGQCLAGFVCNGTNECMPTGHESTLCTPECGSLERCVRAKCEPVCDNRACPAGARCEEGACVMNPRNDYQLGSPCTNDVGCRRASPNGVCLRPYGGGDGVCTRPCTADLDCDGQASMCVTFPNGDKGRSLCVNPAFMPCGKEGTCTASGLSCGVFALEAWTVFEDDIIEPISACRERLTGAAIGETCTSSISCANGLCARLDSSGKESCTSPCEAPADCEAVLGGTQHGCSRVTINPNGDNDMPRTRPKMCSKGGSSIGGQCTLPFGGCFADASYCNDEGGLFGVCATACGDGGSSCPAGHVCVPQEGSTPDLCIRE